MKIGRKKVGKFDPLNLRTAISPSILDFLHKTKKILSKKFEMKDLENLSFVLRIQIHRDRFRCIFRLSQKTYLEKVVMRFGMQGCKP